jgi:predicted nucleotidyltransferase
MTEPLSKDEIVRRLAGKRAELDRLSVKSLRLFGSFATNAANDNSDVDLIVEFDAPMTFDRLMETKFLLEDLFGRRVDLGTEANLRKELKARILQEAVRVA